MLLAKSLETQIKPHLSAVKDSVVIWPRPYQVTRGRVYLIKMFIVHVSLYFSPLASNLQFWLESAVLLIRGCCFIKAGALLVLVALSPPTPPPPPAEAETACLVLALRSPPFPPTPEFRLLEDSGLFEGILMRSGLAWPRNFLSETTERSRCNWQYYQLHL